MSARDVLLNQYEFIKREVHLAKSDLNLKNSYSSPILFGLLTPALNSKVLYVGEYGLGKTSLAETISSIAQNKPVNEVRLESLKGHPELTYEEIIGRPDLGKLNLGEEKVIWSNFSKSKFKVIDELNRIPEHKQNILLTGLQSSVWQYLNESLTVKEMGVIATTNYSDSANNSIIPPLMDRFDLRLEVKSPTVNISRLIRTKKGKGFEDIVASDQKEFRKQIYNTYGLRLITKEEYSNLGKEIDEMPFSQESHLYIDVILSELASCQTYGNKRKTDECPQGCHFANYGCNKIESPMSVRTIKSLNNYSKAIAYIEKEKEVLPTHITKILPYAVNHKLGAKYEEEFEEQREDNKELYYFKKLAGNIEKRFYQIKNKQQDFVSSIINNDFNAAKNIAKEMDHPVFLEYLK